MIEVQPPDLVKYMERCTSTFEYASSTSAWDIVTSINNTIEKETLKQVREAPFYALLADEAIQRGKRKTVCYSCALPVKIRDQGQLSWDKFMRSGLMQHHFLKQLKVSSMKRKLTSRKPALLVLWLQYNVLRAQG